MPTHDLVYTGLSFPVGCPDGGDGDTWGFSFALGLDDHRRELSWNLGSGLVMFSLSVQFVYRNPVISLLLPDVSRPCVLALGV